MCHSELTPLPATGPKPTLASSIANIDSSHHEKIANRIDQTIDNTVMGLLNLGASRFFKMPRIRFSTSAEVAELTVIYMDAGQGDCTLILFPDGKTNWMVDCGSIKNGQIVRSEIVKVLDRVLPSRGNTVQRLILTHPDQDHYNLLSTVVPMIPNGVGEIVYGGEMTQYKNQLDKNYTYNLLVNFGNKAISPSAKVNWNPTTIGGAIVSFLAANASGNVNDTNNNSVVLLVEYMNYKFFLMGDAEIPTENFILGNWTASSLQSTFGVALKMGHHGSDTASSQNWVQTIKPTALIVSADTRGFGKFNRGMPANSKITNAVSWSGRVGTLHQSLSHNYVVWCDDCPPTSNYAFKPMMVVPATVQAVCTTLYNLAYDNTYTDYSSEGGSWYFTMKDDGILYVGFTGS